MKPEKTENFEIKKLDIEKYLKKKTLECADLIEIRELIYSSIRNMEIFEKTKAKYLDKGCKPGTKDGDILGILFWIQYKFYQIHP